ncbi:MAG: hypothetical protein F6J93_02980 [Oscillatoria sp. SIO1A7]|nr:hypothetical protein [Oscillatoria sp. SIO1A7]
MEILLLLTIIVLQLVLITLVLQRQPRPVLEGPAEEMVPRLPREETDKEGASSESLWDEPPPPSEELRYTIKEFKSKYNRNDSWDGDFVL